MKKEKYPIGTEVYYSIEDYDTGESIIHKGKITKIFYNDLNLNGKTIHSKFYEINNGWSMQENCFYTINELFKMKERLEYLQNELSKEKLINE